MNFEEHAKFMDSYIHDNHIQLLIDIPAGTSMPELVTNPKVDVVAQLCLLVSAFVPAYRHIREKFEDKIEMNHDDFLDGIFALTKAQILEDVERDNDKRRNF